MNGFIEDAPSSPTEVCNFIIPYSEEADLIQNIQTDNFLQYLKTEKSVETGIISGTDKSFFPRAFTDLNNLAGSEMDMEGRDNGGFETSYQPDVIMTNSHQRSGPDGSPALVTAISQRFAAPANLSESGELFAPVRTLTFSDIDQSSHVEDSYFDSSRLVSTPNKNDKGKFGNDHYDYSSLTDNRFQTIENNENIGADSDSSDSDNLINGMRDSVTPEFRQLEGEADNELANTGPFHPSTHGLSKEFMDNFVGKTGNQEAMCDNNIFSPLGSNYRMHERRVLSKTPPLHSPGPNSPYSKSCNSPRGQKSPRFEQSPRLRPSPKGQDWHRQDPDEIQFDISPSKDQSSCPPFNQEALGKGNSGETFYYGNVVSSHSFNPATIPKNLNEYFEQVTNDQFMAQRFNTTNTSGYHTDKNEMASRQGDGSDNDLDDRPQKLLPPPDAEALVPETTSLNLESKYLQKTQVSVKLPQATYDTISANTSHDERFTSSDQHQSNRPDVAATGNNGIDNTAHTSGGKVMDLLQNQVDQSDQNTFTTRTGNGSIDQKSVDKKTSTEKDKHLNPIDSRSIDVKNDSQENATTAEVPDSLQKSVENVESRDNSNSNISKVKSSEKAPNQITPGSNTIPSQSHSEKSETNQSVVSQGSNQPPSHVASRLFQETVSQRNKTTQKFVSSAPAPSKSYTTSQGKDFKKPYDSIPKNNVACSGSRKLSNDTGAKKPATSETCPKFKASDRTKPKSASNDSLNQKSKHLGNQSRNMQNFNENSSQSRLYNQNSSASNQGQGQYVRGQFLNKGQGKAGAFSGDGHMHSDDEGHGQGRIVTQVENTSPVAIEQPSQNRNIRQVPGLGDSSLDIKGMEEVRHQLQSMMKMSYEQMNAQDRSQYEHSDIIAGFGVELGDQHRLMEKSWNHFRNPGEEDLMDNFPSFSSQYFTDSGNVSRSEASVHTENQRLRDMLEKERYRRKHCEQYIQQLNVKLLETQQQVAVAVSTDKRKDLMIEQLDKQLARVMEGWKKRDQEKDDLMSDIQKEKEEIENNMKQQQQMISNFEHDMSEAVEALRHEKEKAAQDLEQLKDKIQSIEHDKKHAEELVEAEKEKGDLLQQECENLRESRETLDKKLDQMQKRLHREQDDWFQREQELLQRIDEVSEKTNKVLQVERAKNEEQGKLAEEIMEQYQSAVTNVKKLEMELDAAHREKESLKVEMGIMEAKFENDQRVLEADLSSTMEKRIAEQISDVQKRHEAMVDNLQEKHREQMLELSMKNGRDMETQLSVFRNEMQKKEEEYRKQLQELESRLTEYRNENAELKRSKQKLESTRLEILTKLQYAMQTQWNEALSMLSATPQRTQTQSRTPGSEEDTSSTLQGSPAVNFNFFAPSNSSSSQHSVVQPLPSSTTPPRPSANPTTPPRQSASRASFDRSLANQISPVPRHLSNQDRVAISSPGGESIVSHSTERDPTDHLEATVETAAMSHMKQFQDYMDSFAKTPEWISSMASQSEVFNSLEVPQNAANSQQMAAPQLSSPSDFTAFLSTHLQNIQQQQHSMTSSYPTSVSHPVTFSHSLPNSNVTSNVTNKKQCESTTSFSLPPNFQQISNLKPFDVSNADNASRKASNSRNVKEISESRLNQSETTSLKLNNQSEYSMYNANDYRMSLEGASGLSRAVALHPPQQGEDPYSRDDHESTHSENVSRGFFQGGQSFSPPTKQNKDNMNNSTEDLTNQSNRLNDDYSQLSERLEQHGSHQQELQHYIQMLLNKSPGEVHPHEQNDSLFSQDNEELDLNDTAQAALLQKELDRIQQLREKQVQDTSKSSSESMKVPSAPAANGDGQAKILTQEQLAEVTKLLNEVKGQGQPQSEHPQVMELLELLKHAQLDQGNQSAVKKGTRPAARAPASHLGDKHRPGQTMGRRNVQFHPGKGVDSSKGQHQELNKDKAGPKCTQSKKVERKVAGSATKGEKGPKPNVWK